MDKYEIIIKNPMILKRFDIDQLRLLSKQVGKHYAAMIRQSKKNYRLTEESFVLNESWSKVNKIIKDEIWDRRERPS